MKNTQNKTVKTARQTKRIESSVKATTQKKEKLSTHDRLANYVALGKISDKASASIEDLMNRGFSYTEARKMVMHIACVVSDGTKDYDYNFKFTLDTRYNAIVVKNANPLAGVVTVVTPLADGTCHVKDYQTARKATASSLYKAPFVVKTEETAKDVFTKAVKGAPYANLLDMVRFIYSCGSHDVDVYSEAVTPYQLGVESAIQKALAKTEQVNKALAKKADKVA